MSMVLDVAHISAGYHGSQVITDFNLQIRRGEIATLLGRNGAGKTTLLRAICGVIPLHSGHITFCDTPISGLSVDRIARCGIALVPEGRHIFPNLNVRENLLAFAANRSGTTTPWSLEKVFDYFPLLRTRARHPGGKLSGGEQQMLAIGRALMTNPHLLILDEATEGLAPLIREDIWRCLKNLKSEGQTILVVDKYVNKLVTIADHHTLIEKGHVVWQGTSTALLEKKAPWQHYLTI